MKKAAIIYYSKANHTVKIANHLAAGIQSSNMQSLLYTPEEATSHIDELEEMDAIIFGSPTYFGSMAAELKGFMDSTGEVWQKKKWRNKIAAGFTNSSTLSGDKLNVLMQMAVFALQHGMIWVGLDLQGGEKIEDQALNRLGSWTGLMSQSDFSSSEISKSDALTAEYFGRRIASIVNKFNK